MVFGTSICHPCRGRVRRRWFPRDHPHIVRRLWVPWFLCSRWGGVCVVMEKEFKCFRRERLDMLVRYQSPKRKSAKEDNEDDEGWMSLVYISTGWGSTIGRTCEEVLGILKKERKKNIQPTFLAPNRRLHPPAFLLLLPIPPCIPPKGQKRPNVACRLRGRGGIVGPASSPLDTTSYHGHRTPGFVFPPGCKQKYTRNPPPTMYTIPTELGWGGGRL